VKFGQKIDAVAVRQRQIEQNQVVGPVADPVQAFVAVAADCTE